MLKFRYKQDQVTGDTYIETPMTGKPLLTTPQLNKGTAFTLEERIEFGLLGKLPSRVESLEEQVRRCYSQYHAYEDNLKKNIFLNELHENNQVLFYKLVSEYLAEMLPTIYTPIVGTAVKQFSHEFRQPRGLYLSYPERDYMYDVLNNRSNPNIDLIVVTDGEGVLGIGDQGVGGMDIPIAKLMVYSICGGIDPVRTLPIQLDVGTNNQQLLDDPMYLGWRHERLEGAEYDSFIEQFVTTITKEFPNVFLHWEDFGRENARRNLERFRDKVCTFNDDMQGTGVVTLSAIIAAVNAAGGNLKDQRIAVFGAGTAGTGISDQIHDAMCHEGLDKTEAYNRFYLLDRQGLLTSNLDNITNFQQPYVHDASEINQWAVEDKNNINLLEVVKHAKPTILIGCSAVPGAFTKEIIKEMAKYCKHPIILPLSNPTERCEAQPKEILEWTQGQALIATGSPFADVHYEGHDIRIGQCNNALVFPGIGLGMLATKSKTLTDEMLWVACRALSEFAPVTHDIKAPLLPSLNEARNAARHIAIAVAKEVFKEGCARVDKDDPEKLVDQQMWSSNYVPYRLEK